MLSRYKTLAPLVEEGVFIAPGAQVIGNVVLKSNASIWHNAVLRGDMARITVGTGSNVQDNCTVHCDLNKPVVIGDNVTIGHNAVLHSCTVGDGTTIGMGAIVLNDAYIGKNCMIAAGALVTPRTVIPDGSMVMGSPAVVKRPMREEEKAAMLANAAEYVKISKEYK